MLVDIHHLEKGDEGGLKKLIEVDTVLYNTHTVRRKKNTELQNPS